MTGDFYAYFFDLRDTNRFTKKYGRLIQPAVGSSSKKEEYFLPFCPLRFGLL